MCDDKVFDRFTSGMTAGKERFRCVKWRWWHIRVRRRQRRRCSAPHTYLVNLKCYTVQVWLWSLQYKILFDTVIVTLVLCQRVKCYPDFFFLVRIGCCNSFLLFIYLKFPSKSVLIMETLCTLGIPGSPGETRYSLTGKAF